jgi:ABC-type transporter Mla subunit MlaD
VRRLAAAGGALGAIAVGLALSAAGGGASSGGSYRVDAIFDNASFLIPGQDVKIAGAKVGSVVDVKLTPQHKARIQMSVGKQFAPFRSDADCTIQPQSLIGEKFIQCTPGTPDGAPLRSVDGQAPTVPLSDTHSPVDIDLVNATFRQPTSQRLGLLLSELGAGFAARGDDLNAAILRANPALQETRRVMGILSDDRAQLRDLIGASDVVQAARVYAPDLVGGLLNGFGGSAGSTYDANGHYVRIALVGNLTSLSNGASLLTPSLPRGTFNDFRDGITNRCPGAATQPVPDKSNPFAAPEAQCNPKDTP